MTKKISDAAWRGGYHQGPRQGAAGRRHGCPRRCGAAPRWVRGAGGAGRRRDGGAPAGQCRAGFTKPVGTGPVGAALVRQRWDGVRRGQQGGAGPGPCRVGEGRRRAGGAGAHRQGGAAPGRCRGRVWRRRGGGTAALGGDERAGRRGGVGRERE
ncbi:hypothetical protein PVAP13_3KG274327 [Panicum virgatum]|uniref:Uncharacterized protein n=1 Tax=Panicum virgatum TaxID=38727 RepID=A0A8T0V1A4_PANVG|nr:hypothetical protein PVAP13_3KG274327 [Panicum virgatum]